MSHTAVRCKRCKRGFDRKLEECPGCGQLSPHGRRMLVIKWIAILVFLVSVASIAGTFLQFSGGH